MASISTAANGLKTVQFVGADRRRRTVRLGKVPVKTAEEVCRRIQYLASAIAMDVATDPDTALWVSKISDKLHGRLAAVGLVGPRLRVTNTLKAFLDGYIAGRTDIKPRTKINLEACAARLIEYFTLGKSLANIKPGDADDFCAWLRTRYAQATAARTIKRAKQFFTAALRKGIVASNPFADCKAGHQHNKARAFFVSQDAAAKVLEACPDGQWRLMFALARYGGLRCPSEILNLERADINWAHDKMHIRSSKQEHLESGGERWVPIFPELRPYLEEVFELAPEGSIYVITRYRDDSANLRTGLNRIIKRAGLEPWERPWHNLRASRQTELAKGFPLHVVCYWLGNKAAVAEAHYLQVTDADFERAAKSGARALQNQRQQAPAEDGIGSHKKQKTPGKPGLLPLAANCCESMQNGPVPPSGVHF
jgi:integrase